MDREATMFFECCYQLWGLVQHRSNGGGASLISKFGYWCWDVLATTWTTSIMYKNVANFDSVEFEELWCILWCLQSSPMLALHVELLFLLERLSNWPLRNIFSTLFCVWNRRMLSYMTHAFMWNWSKSSLCDMHSCALKWCTCKWDPFA
jgi:hypothetical protein